jgi:signal transduction histidine kinase
MLVGGTLSLALVYFRIQRWKAHTITQERERLARDIHDTMAQSFAGIGYQIQGIRHGVVGGDPLNSSDIADQLTVAYQLVRRCHEEASRTIAMLASIVPPMQQNLLGSLEELARRVATCQIKIIVESSGAPSQLKLRLADALVHIGREAIVNALAHSDPTVLTIRLKHALAMWGRRCTSSALPAAEHW